MISAEQHVFNEDETSNLSLDLHDGLGDGLGLYCSRA